MFWRISWLMLQTKTTSCTTLKVNMTWTKRKVCYSGHDFYYVQKDIYFTHTYIFIIYGCFCMQDLQLKEDIPEAEGLAQGPNYGSLAFAGIWTSNIPSDQLPIAFKHPEPRRPLISYLNTYIMCKAKIMKSLCSRVFCTEKLRFAVVWFMLGSDCTSLKWVWPGDKFPESELNMNVGNGEQVL